MKPSSAMALTSAMPGAGTPAGACAGGCRRAGGRRVLLGLHDGILLLAAAGEQRGGDGDAQGAIEQGAFRVLHLTSWVGDTVRYWNRSGYALDEVAAVATAPSSARASSARAAVG